MAAFEQLEDVSKAFKNKLKERTIVGAVRVENLDEEEIVYMKEAKKALEAKIRIEKLHRDIESAEEPNSDEPELLDHALNKQGEANEIVNYSLMNALESVYNDHELQAPELIEYKEKITRLLTELKFKCEEYMQIQEKNEKVLQEINEIENTSATEFHNCAQHLEDMGKNSADKLKVLLTPEYTKHLAKVNETVRKLNIARIILVRLLASGQIDGTRHMNLLKLLAKYRYPYTLESLQKE